MGMLDAIKKSSGSSIADTQQLPARQSCVKSIQRELDAMNEQDRTYTSIHNVAYGKRNKEDNRVLKAVWATLDELYLDERKHSNVFSRAWKSDGITNELRKRWPAIKEKYPYVSDHDWYILFARKWVPSSTFHPYDTDHDMLLKHAMNVVEAIESGQLKPSNMNCYIEVCRLTSTVVAGVWEG